jgi:hypothetical protein
MWLKRQQKKKKKEKKRKRNAFSCQQISLTYLSGLILHSIQRSYYEYLVLNIDPELDLSPPPPKMS